jgi:hypothetical protein
MGEEKMIEGLQNRISYCEKCSSTLYWDNQGIPQMIKLGNKDVPECLDRGCTLIYMQVPEDCCNPGEMELLRLALIQNGLSVEAADSAVASLGFQNIRLAA